MYIRVKRNGDLIEKKFVLKVLNLNVKINILCWMQWLKWLKWMELWINHFCSLEIIFEALLSVELMVSLEFKFEMIQTIISLIIT